MRGPAKNTHIGPHHGARQGIDYFLVLLCAHSGPGISGGQFFRFAEPRFCSPPHLSGALHVPGRVGLDFVPQPNVHCSAGREIIAPSCPKAKIVRELGVGERRK